MVWHIRKVSKNDTSGYKYYQGDDAKTPSGEPDLWGNYGSRETYSSQAKAKAVSVDWNSPDWSIKAINENA